MIHELVVLLFRLRHELLLDAEALTLHGVLRTLPLRVEALAIFFICDRLYIFSDAIYFERTYSNGLYVAKP